MNKMNPVYGELRPVGGGDTIPLMKSTLIIGRRESCDIVLKFPNVSSVHCKLSIVDGKWMVKDLKSSNGTKINNEQIEEDLINPGDILSVGKHKYEMHYNTLMIGESNYDLHKDIFSKSLLESAGLEGRRFK